MRAPLNNLLKKYFKWHLTDECQKALEKIKEILTSDLFLAHFDPNQEVVVSNDASYNGIGAGILLKYKDGTMKAVTCASRSRQPAKIKYSQIKKENLAIIYAVKKFHKYIHGRSFTLQTDHRALIRIFGSKKGLPTYTANTVHKWGIILWNNDFKMEFLSSNKLGYADGLSRLIPRFCEPLEDTVIAVLRAKIKIKNVLFNTVRGLPVTLTNIKIKKQNRICLLMKWKNKLDRNQMKKYSDNKK